MHTVHGRRTLVGALLTPILALALLPGAGNAQCRATVLVAYYSETGHARTMAEALAAGAIEAGATVVLRTVDSVATDALLAADAIVLGSPVHNANVAAPVQAFISGWPFEGRPLADKVGAAFVAGGGISAGQEATQLALVRALLIHGLVVVGGADWFSAFGAAAVTDEEPFVGGAQPVDERFLAKARGLGARVARVAARLRCGGGSGRG
ncbi:MAG: flavodoxin family protein [Gemmatimonadales bacterium]|jgi:NAD(P)H dehydrogenase (quinone)